MTAFSHHIFLVDVGRLSVVILVSKGRRVPLQSHLALDKVSIEGVHQMCHLFLPIKCRPDNFVSVDMGLELDKDVPVLLS